MAPHCQRPSPGWFLPLAGLFVLFLFAAGTAHAQDGADDLYSRKVGNSTLRLIDVSLDVLLNGGGSSEPDTVTQALQAGGHDPNKRGFTLSQAELSFVGAVDPYLRAEAHLIGFIDPEGETGIELEEAFAVTTSLPANLQAKAGHFFTEFGRINPTHPHAWNWLDQPVINSRLFGGDGLRAPGARVSWLVPVPWYAEVLAGIQNASGETATSFLANEEVYAEAPPGGRLWGDAAVRDFSDMLYLVRLSNAWDMGDTLSAKLGSSALFGPNATGRSGRTTIIGADLVVKWKPLVSEQGWPFLTWESEFLWRNFKAALFNNGTITIPQDTLRDWGLYSQMLWGFHPRWALGVRYEIARGSGTNVDVQDTNADGVLDTWTLAARNTDPLRDNRQRISPLLIWQFSEFARLRLQYNYDRASHLPKGDAHAAWGGLEFLIGAHPAHAY